MKCEVLKDCVLAIKKGSVVEVDDRQFEMARMILKPVEKVKAEAKAEAMPESAEEKPKKTRKK